MGEIARRSVSAAVLALAALLLSPAVFAAGLGRLNVFSALGEPLRAEIELVSLQPGEVDSLSVRLAPTQAFSQANIDFNGALLAVKFGVERRANGQHVVTMSSVQPMNEPFIDLLVELSWTSGRLVREYTFLLDPPDYRGPAVAAVPAIEPPVAQAIPAPAAAPQAATPAPAEPAIAAEPRAKPASQTAASKPAAAASYEVKRGDTLAKIAQQNLPEGVGLQQMLVALYRNNRDAFVGDNMNRLRAGRILNLPDRETAAAITADEARRLVNTQSSEYAQYRRSLGEAVAEAPARPDTSRQASGRVGAPAEQKPAPAKQPASDQLRLSRPEDAKAGGKAGASAASDDAAAKEKALREANERIAMLEKNISAMKSQTGAQMQQQAQAAKPEAAKLEAAKPAAAKPEAAKPEAAKPEAAKPEAPKPEAAKPEAATADAAKPAAGDAAKAPEAPKAEAPKPAPKPVAPPPPPPEASILDELLDSPLNLGLIGLAVVMFLGYGFYAVRKKRKQASAASNSTMNVEPAFANSMLAAPGEESVDAGSAPAEPFSGGDTPAATADAEEIDPVAEADVYMAYGRDAQAEEILKESLANEPNRPGVRLKLLEIYANRKDAAAFAPIAHELHAATGGQGPEWEKAAALGMAVDPSNQLYGGAAGAAEPAATDTQVLDVTDITAAPAPDVVLDADPAPAAGPLDFDLDIGGAPAAEAPAAAPAPAEAPTTLDFDLDLGGDKPAAAEAPAADTGMSIDFDLPGAPAAEKPADDGGGLDFDLGTPAPAASADSSPALDLSSINLDLGASGDAAAPDAHWQEVATKLDLAKAYQDMGDKDGARELLNEVLKEGDSGQQGQAKTMLEAIG